ncbi:CaiB/BaiF CoA-transferase family protein [Pseudonocardia sp. N23]|uniref:CaiB/BaiF CoA transferase family protein n=1 Tax=Pseudonocardia sp. N23 TaxID=1987376 RepID=UPI0011452485|nr:CoA transferase [Pseudonocardia sp. N23]
MIFEGLRIVDLTMGWAGPLSTMLFADFGAQVIKIEGPGRLDWWRRGSASKPPPDMRDVDAKVWERSALFCGVNRNKLGVTLDMSSPQGREIFERLVAVSDVVVESFSPRVMKKWGLDHERLAEINPGIIMMSLPAVGSSGPWAHYIGYASTTEAMSGLPALCGYDDAPILQTPFVADPLGGLNGATALAFALYHRELTGEGQRIEVGQHEGLIPLIGHGLMEYQLTGEIPARSSTGDSRFAPNGCYPCQGDDRWVVISVATDDEWIKFCGATGRPELLADPALRTAQGRQENRGRIDDLTSEWTRQHDRRDAMEILQRAGVVAAAVNNAADLLEDPQVTATEGFVELDRAVVGRHPYPRVSVRLSETPGNAAEPAPLFGEDNDFVLREILGLRDDEVRELRELGVVAETPMLN